MPATKLATVIALVAYLGTLLAFGFVARRRFAGFSGWITGAGRIPAWMLALSFLANFLSSNSFVGHSSRSYKAGLVWCLVGAVMVVACALSWHVFAPRFAAFARDRGAVTLPDFFAIRFGSTRLAALVHWLVVASTLLYVLAVMRGTGLVLKEGLGTSYEGALVVLWFVVLAYCLLGGLWADVSTDVFQTFFLVAGAVGLIVAVATAPASAGTPPPLEPAPLGLVLSVGLGGGLKMLADPKQVMVFFALPSETSVRRFRWLAPGLLLVCYACLLPVGYLARPVVPALGGDLETLVPRLVFEREVLGAWFGTAFLVALLAASMSSLDSALLVMASCLEKHVVAPLLGAEPSERRARVALLAVATLALGLAVRPIAGIIELTTFAGALMGATILPSVCVGLSKREVPAGAIAVSIVCGVLGTLAGKFVPGWLGWQAPWFQDVFVGLLASSVSLAPWLVRRNGAAAV